MRADVNGQTITNGVDKDRSHIMPPDEEKAPITYGTREIIGSVQRMVDEQLRDLAKRDNHLKMIEAEMVRLRGERDLYMRASVSLAQQMEAVSQLCEAGLKMAMAAAKIGPQPLDEGE